MFGIGIFGIIIFGMNVFGLGIFGIPGVLSGTLGIILYAVLSLIVSGRLCNTDSAFLLTKLFAKEIDAGVEGIRLRYLCLISGPVSFAKELASNVYVLFGSELLFIIYF